MGNGNSLNASLSVLSLTNLKFSKQWAKVCTEKCFGSSDCRKVMPVVSTNIIECNSKATSAATTTTTCTQRIQQTYVLCSIMNGGIQNHSNIHAKCSEMYERACYHE